MPTADGLPALRLEPGGPTRGRKAVPSPTPPRRGPPHAVGRDHPENSLLIARLLERQGHQVVVVRNSHEAVGASPSDVFDAVMLDLVMPEMDALDATRAIRVMEAGSGQLHAGDRRDRRVPGRGASNLRRRGLDACMAKPLEPPRWSRPC
ncbi:MAG: response regulator [Ardenticatenia bacterium]|nr:response regulator [Ardenticatenia bacterium]